MRSEFQFYPKLVVRTPNLSFSRFQDRHFDLNALITDASFMEAIYIASPVLYEEVVKYRRGKITATKDVSKLKDTLFKYYTRMSTRCTPFGLFSGCAVVEWSTDQTNLELGQRKERHTRLDMQYLCSLISHLGRMSVIKERLRYFTNNTVYSIGDENRYIECKSAFNKRQYFISSFPKDEILDRILFFANNGVQYELLCSYVTEIADVTIEKAKEFLDELIDNQLLISEIEPVITGVEILERTISVLREINQPKSNQISEIIEILDAIAKCLIQIDRRVSLNVGAYKEIEKGIALLDVPFDVSRLFQVDSFSIFNNGAVCSDLQGEIIHALNVLNHFNKASQISALQTFANKFLERYGEREMPLLEVIDNETGIGYADSGSSAFTPLLDDVSLVKKEQKEIPMRWTAIDSYLMNKVLEVIRSGEDQIELDSKEEFKNPHDWSKLPPSFSVTVKLLERDRIYVENIGGASAINLLGRFAHGSDDIAGIANDLIKIEEAHNNDVILAEVVFLPESRRGNVLQRPSFRKFEIPFLTHSGVAAESQIALSDIVVSVRQQQIFLRSKAHNKRIIPRISTAHNWHETSSLPIYRFFGDLQLQNNQQGIHFKWGSLESQFKYLPRVCYKNIVFKPAQWKLSALDLVSITGSSEPFGIRVANFRKSWKMPRFVVLADGDNELFIDFENESVADYWISLFKKRPQVILKEFLMPASDNGLMDTRGEVFNHQILAFLYRGKPSYSFRNPTTLISDELFRSNRFSIGSEWMFFKIYCGVKTAEIVLLEAIKPAIEEMQRRKFLKNFFFIRYLDPDFHLRIRFQLKDISCVGEAMQIFSQYIRPFEEKDYIGKLQMDAYERELSRYGVETMELSESVFNADSLSILEFLQLTDGDNREHLRWLWGILSIDRLLGDFGLSMLKKMTLLEDLKIKFHAEFEIDRIVRDDLNGKYRMHRKTIENLLSDDNSAEMPIELVAELGRRSIAMSAIAREIIEKSGESAERVLVQLLPSYLHMHVNRLMVSKYRVHELVVYDMLFSYYRSAVKRVTPPKYLNHA